MFAMAARDRGWQKKNPQGLLAKQWIPGSVREQKVERDRCSTSTSGLCVHICVHAHMCKHTEVNQDLEYTCLWENHNEGSVVRPRNGHIYFPVLSMKT